jgi:hypothetical protein
MFELFKKKFFVRPDHYDEIENVFRNFYQSYNPQHNPWLLDNDVIRIGNLLQQPEFKNLLKPLAEHKSFATIKRIYRFALAPFPTLIRSRKNPDNPLQISSEPLDLFLKRRKERLTNIEQSILNTIEKQDISIIINKLKEIERNEIITLATHKENNKQR